MMVKGLRVIAILCLGVFGITIVSKLVGNHDQMIYSSSEPLFEGPTAQETWSIAVTKGDEGAFRILQTPPDQQSQKDS